MIISCSSWLFSKNHFNSYSRFYRYYMLLVLLSCLINSIAAKPGKLSLSNKDGCQDWLGHFSCSIDKPNILSAQQVDESTVQLKWSVSSSTSEPNKVDNTYDYDNDDKPLELTRYRVLLSTDDFYRDNTEWPAQADYSGPSSLPGNKNNGVLFTIIDSPSTFDCFIECVRNPLCSFATHLYSRENGKYECHLKSNLTNLSVLSGHEEDQELEQSHNSAKIIGQ